MPTPSPCSVNLVGDYYVYDGYAGMSEYVAVGLEQLGVDVNLIPLSFDATGMSGNMLALAGKSNPASLGPGPVLFNSWIRPELERFSGYEHYVHTMWESSRLPPSWVGPVNRARAVMVPTRYVADVFRASGVSVPIEITPDGVDPSVYHYVPRPPREGGTTLIVSKVVPRKHFSEALQAWQLAFEGDDSARLIIKARVGSGKRGVRPSAR
jgi:glycosyltransferase involved in cell wall biosynthesis